MKQTRTSKITQFNRSIAEHRNKVNQFIPKIKTANNIQILKYCFTVAPETKLPIWVFRPINICPPYPTLLYIPGTGFVAQPTAVTQAIWSNIAELAKCQIIVITHRLAPEHPFPTALNDISAIIKYLVFNTPKSLYVDKNHLALAGYSSGGNLAAQIALTLELPICCQILISPLVDLSRSILDYNNSEQQDNVITDSFVEWFLNLYIPPNINRDEPRVSPYYHQIKQHKKLIPAYILFGEHDRFRGDSEGYIKKLRSANGFVKSIMFQKSNHSFLWYQYAAFETIANIIKNSFSTALAKSIKTLTTLQFSDEAHVHGIYYQAFLVHNAFFILFIKITTNSNKITHILQKLSNEELKNSSFLCRKSIFHLKEQNVRSPHTTALIYKTPLKSQQGNLMK